MRVSLEDRPYPIRKKKHKKSKKPHKRLRRKRGAFFGFRRLFYWVLIFAIWVFILACGYVGYAALKLPQASSWQVPERPPSIRIVDRHGTLVANRGITGGEELSLRDMSPWIPKAVIAIEDRRFYSHYGIDPLGIVRAAINNLWHQSTQGGSTLTQQLAKNLFLTPQRTFERKVQEALLALWLEHRYSKTEILQMYLNRVYLGAGTFGVEAASRRYFNKSAKDLNLNEATLLAGLLKAPSRLSPARHPKAARVRARTVLLAMREQGVIDDKSFAQVGSEAIAATTAAFSGSENYFADEVVDQLPFLIGEVDRDVVIETTLDMRLQKVAEQAISERIEQDALKRSVTQGALVSIDKSGAIRALVGGVNYDASQYNRAIDAKRQPGSTFKPFVYVAALEAGLTPNSLRNDAPVTIGRWSPHNYSNKYFGEVTLATALSHSLNSVAAQLIRDVGTEKVIKVAHRLGIHSALTDNASIALGTSEVSLLELTGAYVPLANGGYRPQLRLITRITDLKGKVLYDFGEIQAERVLSPTVVAMMNAMLEQTVTNGTAKHANIGRPTAGKTGTSQNFRDAWFIGYTADYITGVWFGNDDGRPMKNVTGSTLPVAAWKLFMQNAQQNLPVSPLPDVYQLENALPSESDEIPETNHAPSPYHDQDSTDPEQNFPVPNEQARGVTKPREHRSLLDIIREN